MKLDKNMKIAVIAGGMSDEREVSLVTGNMLYKTLCEGGYTNVKFIDVGFDLAEKLREFSPDVVVNGLHGRYGEDGTVQGLLEMMKIPYTNSGVTASAVGMDKLLCRAVMKTRSTTSGRSGFSSAFTAPGSMKTSRRAARLKNSRFRPM